MLHENLQDIDNIKDKMREICDMFPHVYGKDDIDKLSTWQFASRILFPPKEVGSMFKVDYTTTVRHLHEDNRCTVFGVQPEYYRIEYDQF